MYSFLCLCLHLEIHNLQFVQSTHVHDTAVQPLIAVYQLSPYSLQSHRPTAECMYVNHFVQHMFTVKSTIPVKMASNKGKYT